MGTGSSRPKARLPDPVPDPGEERGTPLVGDTIWQLAGPSDGSQELDVVLFHGLQPGSFDKAYFTTWRALAECIATGFPRARIMSVRWDSSAVTWRAGADGQLSWAAMANALTTTLALVKGIGDRPLFFVGHSLGGLMAKQVYLEVRAGEQGLDGDRYKKISQAVAGMAFYATPHSGSKLTDLATKLLALPFMRKLAEPSAMLQHLTVFNEQAGFDNIRFEALRNPASGRLFPTLALAETKPYTLLAKDVDGGPTAGMLASRLVFNQVVVEIASAHPSSIDHCHIITGADHNTITKPTQKDKDPRYLYLKRLLKGELRGGGQPSSSAPAAAAISPTAQLDSISSFEKRYIREVLPLMDELAALKERVGPARWPECLFLPPSASDADRDRAFAIMREVTVFWRDVQRAYKPKEGAPRILHDSFWTRNWLSRGAQYRREVEPLDICNWYFRNKNVQSGHYIDGINDEFEDDNNKRPGRYLMLQRLERQGLPGGHVESSLDKARQLKQKLGTTRWQDLAGTQDQAAELQPAAAAAASPAVAAS